MHLLIEKQGCQIKSKEYQKRGKNNTKGPQNYQMDKNYNNWLYINTPKGHKRCLNFHSNSLKIDPK
jgi:hypothetical protein